MSLREEDKCCISGFIHTGSPVGEITKLGSLDCYVTKPNSDSKHALLILTDVFGHTLPNTQLIADTFAEKLEIPVYVPDIVLGKPLHLSVAEKIKAGDVSDWLEFKKTHTPDVIEPIVVEAYKSLKKDYEKVFVQGYCYGGIYLFFDGFDVAGIISTHPGHFELNVLDNLNVNLLFQLPKKDMSWREGFSKLEEKVKSKQDLHKITFYENVEHGWAVRADPNDAVAMNAKEKACQETVDFIKTLM